MTRDGARIETKGAWKVDGRRVLFTLPNGTLSIDPRPTRSISTRAPLVTTQAKEAPAAPAPALGRRRSRSSG